MKWRPPLPPTARGNGGAFSATWSPAIASRATSAGSCRGSTTVRGTACVMNSGPCPASCRMAVPGPSGRTRRRAPASSRDARGHGVACVGPQGKPRSGARSSACSGSGRHLSTITSGSTRPDTGSRRVGSSDAQTGPSRSFASGRSGDVLPRKCGELRRCGEYPKVALDASVVRARLNGAAKIGGQAHDRRRHAKGSSDDA